LFHAGKINIYSKNMPTSKLTNFAFLKTHDEQLVRLGMLAERYLADDPNTCLIKTRQFGELLAQQVAAKMGIYKAEGESQDELLRRLQDDNILSREIYQLFGEIRRVGNAASHAVEGDQPTALNMLKVAWQLGVWFERTFFKPEFKANEFFLPAAPRDESGALRAELERLSAETARVKAALVQQQAISERKRSSTLQKYRTAAQNASRLIHLDEPATRQLIDAQLRQAGWEADTLTLRYGNGTRPKKGRIMAIAEWPTTSGPADYVLFIGLMPVAVVEAKRKNLDVSTNLQQAKRYSRDFQFTDEMQSLGGAWGKFHIPFAFSANGRPYLRQLETLSGIWFVDLRNPQNSSYALDGWYTPEGLKELLKRDEAGAEKQLETEPFDYGFTLRYYRKDAIRAVEQGIAEGRRAMLIAMATGTGKTKTAIALLYRILKVKRFRRVLFLVDRSALGEQTGMNSAQNASLNYRFSSSGF
jgi:type I restriction enzyme R subunit